MAMTTQVFTFGCGQLFAGHFVSVSASSAERCRELMFEAFGPKWSMQYDEVPSGFDMKLFVEINELPTGAIHVRSNNIRVVLP